MRPRGPSLPIALAILVAGCLIPTGGCACSPPPPFMAWIRGDVTREDGAPVAGAELRWSGRPGTECAHIEVGSIPSAIANAEGRYFGYVTPPGITQGSTVCVRVVATAGSDSAEGTGIVRLSLPSDPQPMDTLRMNLVLRSRASP